MNRITPETFRQLGGLDKWQPVEQGAPAAGVKYDGGKVRLDLLPTDALEEVAGVMTAALQKYEAENWRKGLAFSRLYGAALRHLFAWWRGEDLDLEYGLSHLAHATCCLLFMLAAEKGSATRVDDRPGMSGEPR